MPTYDELKENYLKQGYDANTAQTLASLDAVDAASSTDTTNTTPEVPVSTQTFDDGSSIQTYKDGSTLVTDSEGNQTFNSATAGTTDAAGTTSGGQDVSSMAAAAAGIKAKPAVPAERVLKLYGFADNTCAIVGLRNMLAEQTVRTRL